MKTKNVTKSQIIFTTLIIVFLVMANISAIGAGNNSSSDIEVVADSKLVVEDWMLKGKHWNMNENYYVIEQEKDPVVKVESWMLDENKWMFEPLTQIVVLHEKKLELENWMINECLWN
jgi:hypothetical protein